jgi:hypothetical protein
VNYTMEELVPVTARLVQAYTGMESTSVSYETAQQLMEAVVYCIRELELSGQVPAAGPCPAQKAYELGKALVEQKVKDALDMYHGILPGFSSYGSCFLEDTVVKGLPEFFWNYDVKFRPQDTILTLDYPVLRDLSGYSGIDRVYEYIRCVGLEQMFLAGFSGDFVKEALSRYNRFYRNTPDNLCGIVLQQVLGHVLAGKPWTEPDSGQEGRIPAGTVFPDHDRTWVMARFEAAVYRMVEKLPGPREELQAYLMEAAGDAAAPSGF